MPTITSSTRTHLHRMHCDQCDHSDLFDPDTENCPQDWEIRCTIKANPLGGLSILHEVAYCDSCAELVA